MEKQPLTDQSRRTAIQLGYAFIGVFLFGCLSVILLAAFVYQPGPATDPRLRAAVVSVLASFVAGELFIKHRIVGRKAVYLWALIAAGCLISVPWIMGWW